MVLANGKEVPCAVCGTMIYRSLSEQSKKNFCSLRCYGDWRATLMQKPERRFFKYVKKTRGCWLWRGGTLPGGYGTFYAGGGRHQPIMISAHRFSWIFHNGNIPDGLLVLHRCDVRLCVNPQHLFLGTAAENTKDCIDKGRDQMKRCKPKRCIRCGEEFQPKRNKQQYCSSECYKPRRASLP
jgi:hypothetical protein